MKKNVWLLVERGRLVGGALDDASMAARRAGLAAREFVGDVPGRPSEERSPRFSRGDRSSRRGAGEDSALGSPSVPRAISRAAPHTILLTSAGEPLYPHDTLGFEAIVSCSEESAFQDAVGSRPGFAPVSRVPGSVWSDPDAFVFVSSADARAHGKRMFGHAVGLRLPPQGDFTDPPRARSPSRLGGGAVGKYVAAALVVFALLFLSRFVASRLSQWVGNAPLRVEETNAIVDDAARSMRDGKMRVSALSPEPLKAFAEVVDAKLQRDPQAYVRALLRLDASRGSFAPQTLPSRAFIAAMAMYVSTDAQLDPQPRWRAFLERLGEERRLGIGVVGYEESRIRKALVSVVTQAQSKGVPRANERGLHALWGVNPLAGKGKSSQGAFSNDSVAAAAKAAVEAADAALAGLERMERVFASVPENERVFRNLLSAQAIAQTLQLTWFADTSSLKDRKSLGARLDKLRTFVDAVPRPERDVLAFLLQERSAALDAKSLALKALASRRIEFLLAAQESEKALCDVYENAVMPDFLLQTLRLVRASGLTVQPVAPWQRCFLGAKVYQAVEKSTFDGVPETAVLAYVPRTGPHPLNLKAHERLFSLNPLVRLADSGVGPEASWHVVAYLSQVLPQRVPWKAPALEERCRKKLLDAMLCTQIAFQLESEAVQRMRLLESVQEDASPSELGHLAFRVALDVYTRKNLVNGRRGFAEDTFRKLGFARFFSQGYPEFPALEWYIKNASF